MPYEIKKVFASLPQVERGVSKIIGGDPKGNNFLYTNGKCVILRNIDDHSRFVNCVRFSPDGNRFATASADGQIYIYDGKTGEKVCSLGGSKAHDGGIYAVSMALCSVTCLWQWSGHIRICSHPNRFCNYGSSVGEITGHNKVINSVDIKQSRPYRLVTGSDDNCAAFFEGPPFKFKFTIGWFASPENCVTLSLKIQPTSWQQMERHGTLGSSWKKAPCGNDRPVPSAQWALGALEGGFAQMVSGKSWRGLLVDPPGCRLSAHVSCGAGDLPPPPHAWAKSVKRLASRRGRLACPQLTPPCLSPSQGHSKSIQCLTVHKNGGKSYIYSGSHDGHINYWDSETGENDAFAGKGHTNQVSRMTVDESGQLVSCSMDDTVRYTSLTLRDYSGQGVVKLDVQPKCVAVGPGGYTVVVCIGQIVLLKGQKKCFSIDNPGYEPEVVAVHPGGDMVAVGGSDGSVRLYSILGTTMKDEDKLLEAKGPVTDLAYSHDGAFLAVCDASKVVTVFSVADGYSENNVFYGHHAKIVCLAWSPDNEHFASGGMDMMVYVWTLSDPETRVKIQDAHRLHHVSSLAWLDEHTLVTTSHDASVKEWTITY
ncbi:PREDICTED: WD repeat-containing protein 1 [Hipposideros armiger]|uniref:WD repeat-containing protein 1 n=1 Tax=Hipposideros armiger TaxID=186990 RepID=A0A8B7SWY8_HIPAR|nr:PREDICTED: WD repeat-containing protein 1 [Hipposideros armiger]